MMGTGEMLEILSFPCNFKDTHYTLLEIFFSDLGILFSPARLEKRAHASLVGRERVTSSPGNQRGHYQSTGDQNREGHRDSRHARDQLHHHHASSNSAHRHSQQQRPDVDSDRRSYAHREQGDPDHRKGRHEHGN